LRLLSDGPGVTNREPAAVSAVGGVVAASPPDRQRTWTAVIEWRDTEDGPRFYVIGRADGDVGEVTIAHSRPLDWPPTGPASVRALPDAVDTLEAALLAAGWRPLPQGGAWYAKRFIAEPSAESAPSVEVAPNGSTVPVGVQPWGPEPRAQGDPADTAPTPSYPAIPSWPLQPHPPRREGGVENGGGAAAEFSAAARVGRLPEDPWGIVREPSDRPVARRGVLLATVGQLVLAAAVIGALLGSAFVAGDGAPAVRPAPAPPTITHGGLRLQVPSGWVRGQAATVPGFSRPLSLKYARERLSAVVELLAASSATLLPAALEKARPTAGERREVVRLRPGQSAWRYRVAHENRSATVLYAAPTTSGVATVACVVPTDAAVPRGCETLAKAITVPGSVPLELGTSVAFYTRLPAAARELEAARSTGMRDLAAATSANGQAAAADGLVRAHERALAALAPFTATRADLPGETVRALKAMAGAYTTLAGAARARSPQRYNAAGRGVAETDAELRRTLAKAAAAANAASRAPTDAGRRAP